MALLGDLVEALRMALPDDWRVDLTSPPALAGDAPDMLVRLEAPDASATTVLVEVKARVVDARDVPRIVRQIAEMSTNVHAGAAIYVSPFVSAVVKDRLTDAGIGWFDPTGNLRLRTRRPAVYVDRQGASRNPFVDPADRRLKSLRGPAAARIVRVLCEADLPMGVRGAAERGDVGVASSSRILDLLDREGLVDRSDGQVLDVRKQALVRRWTQDYGLMVSNEVTPVLDPRGLDHAMALVGSSDEGTVVTGSAAARKYLPAGVVPVTPFTTLTVHCARPTDLIRVGGLRKVERGANMLLVQPFDQVLLTGSRLVEGLRCAAPSQVIADLLTGPGRSGEEAEQLIRMLAMEDPGWRT